MQKGVLLWVLCLLIAVAGSAHAYQLAYKDTAGTVRWYRTQVILYGSYMTQPTNKTIHMSGTVSFTLVEKVLAVGDDGIASIQEKVTDGSVFIHLPDLDMPPVTRPIPEITVTFKRSPKGKVTDITIEGLPASITGMPGMNSTDEWRLLTNASTGLEFPAGEIQAGGTWTTVTSVDIKGQKIDVRSVNTLQGPRVFDQHNYLQINSNITMKAPALVFQITTANGQTVTIHETLDTTMKATTLFDAAAGEMFSTWFDGDSNFTITEPKPGTEQTTTVTGALHISGGISKIAPPANAAPTAPGRQ